jgi:3',5'-cyclic AMP phosphodiesterase CpdA
LTAFRIAHLSDPHLPPPPLPFRVGDLMSKRSLSRFAWRRKHRRHVKAVLDALCADVRARAPDHVAITGDLINFATPEEFAAARAWLETFGDPATVTVSPGNHDALVASGAPISFAPWAPWLGDDGAAFPRLRRRGPVAIVNLSSAVQTSLHLAQGTVGRAQITAAAHLLREAGEAGLFRLVMVHHPVARGVVPGRKALTDEAELAAMLGTVSAELVLHGHAHESHLTTVRGPSGPIPILSVPSASTPTGRHDEPARWNEIEITHTGAGFRTAITAHGVTADGAFTRMGRYVLV